MKDLLVLAPQNDPFYAGNGVEGDKALWFAQLWERFGYGSGAHLRRVHYRIVSEGNIVKPDGELYENNNGCWQYIQGASRQARYLRLVDPEEVVDKRNPAPNIYMGPGAISWEEREEPDKTPRKRASKFIKDLVAPAWQPSRDQVLLATRIVLVLVVLLAILTLIGLPFGITLWAWVKLLIVPAVLAIGGYLFNSAQSRATQAAADQRAQDEALQAYLDYLSERILKDDLREAVEGTGLRRLTRARTLTVLERLGPKSKGRVMQVLAEVELIQRKLPEGSREKRPSYKAFKDEAVVSIRGADLSGAYLRRANLYAVGLLNVDLSNADLSSAKLIAAKLRNANLSRANLSGANLSRADLSRANLNQSDLSYATLREVEGWTEDDLATAESLEGATMPDGQILKSDNNPDGPTFEEWLESKDRVVDV